MQTNSAGENVVDRISPFGELVEVELRSLARLVTRRREPAPYIGQVAQSVREQCY